MTTQGVVHAGAGGDLVQDARRQPEFFLAILTSGEPGLSVHPPYTSLVEALTATKLLDLNRGFYQRFASAFTLKRPRLQPGAARAILGIGSEQSVLDLGCGHGLLAAALAKAGHRGRYVGIDSSRELIEKARRSVDHPQASFIAGELAEAHWADRVEATPFDWIFALAILHHLPGEALRREFVGRVRPCLRAEGWMVVSVWDFSGSARMMKRIVPWENLGMTQEEVEPGDYLLDWREGGRGLRYVHLFTPETLEDLARSCGFRVKETFRSDGEGGRLGIYQVWQR
ncbi:MAG TPA: class I SAM-dependent methyltransferase [Anaerolineales bacterium]|nr:class I SAM-dependent methyltransferase [Anaerolineales bacterium]